MSWLLRDSETPIAPADLSPVKQALGGLEGIFKQAATARKTLDDTFGPSASAPRNYQLEKLKADTERQIAQARLNVEQAFADSLKAAARNVGKAQRDYAASVDGQQQLAALAGFATIGAKLTGDQVAERLEAALDAGLIGQARAWRDVANLQPYADSAKLTLATLRADREAVTPDEVIATGQAAYIQRAMGNYTAWTATINSRFDEAVNYGNGEHGAGNFDPSRIFGDGTQQ